MALLSVIQRWHFCDHLTFRIHRQPPRKLEPHESRSQQHQSLKNHTFTIVMLKWTDKIDAGIVLPPRNSGGGC